MSARLARSGRRRPRIGHPCPPRPPAVASGGISRDLAQSRRADQRVWPDILDAEVRTKVWLELRGQFVIGDGGLQLLLGIAERGSLAGAAQRIGWSYRHAWGYLRRAEAVLGTRLTTSRSGKGRARGTLLTPAGRALVDRLLAVRRRVDRTAGPSGPTLGEIAARGASGARAQDAEAQPKPRET